MDEVQVQRTKQAVESEAAARSTRAALGLVAGELRVSLKDLDDEQKNLVALRFVLDGRVSAAVLKGIVDDVKSAEGVAAGLAAGDRNETGSIPVGVRVAPSAHHPYKFNSTEADAKQRRKLAAQHQAETNRTGLHLVPRKADPLPVGKPHPPCLAAARDGGTPCSLCSWLLDDDPYTEAWLDRDDSTGGR